MPTGTESGPGDRDATPLEPGRTAKPGPSSDTNNTERGDWEISLRVPSGEVLQLKTNFEFSSVLRSRIGSPAKSFEGGR